MARLRSRWWVAAGALVLMASSTWVACTGDDPSLSPVSTGDDGGEAGAPDAVASDGGTDAPPFDLDAACVSSQTIAARLPVYMLLIVDGSGSMSDDNKWAALKPALQSIIDDLAAQQDPSIGLGLVIFSDSRDPNGAAAMPSYPTDADVPIRLVDNGQKAALHARLDPADPASATPTLAVLRGEYPIAEAFDNAAALLPAGGKKVIVFMTDGVPNGGAAEVQDVLTLVQAEAAKAAPEGPVTLFAVGIGKMDAPANAYDPQYLGKLAVAGGTRKSATCNPLETVNEANVCHFQITPGTKTAQQLSQDFTAAITAIRSRASTCEFPLAGAIDPSMLNVLLVRGTGATELVYSDAKDGWTVDKPQAPTRVLLHGASCTTAQSDLRAKISIVVGCATAKKP